MARDPRLLFHAKNLLIRAIRPDRGQEELDQHGERTLPAPWRWKARKPGAGAMLVACRLAGLSALETHYAVSALALSCGSRQAAVNESRGLLRKDGGWLNIQAATTIAPRSVYSAARRGISPWVFPNSLRINASTLTVLISRNSEFIFARSANPSSSKVIFSSLNRSVRTSPNVSRGLEKPIPSQSFPNIASDSSIIF